MNYNENYNNPYSIDRDSDYSKVAKQSASLAQIMRSVYLWMTLALVITGMTSLYISKNYFLSTMVPKYYWIFALLEIGIVFFMSMRIMKMSFSTAGVLFGAFSILNGVTLSFIFLIFSSESIATTFFVTAGMFASMSLIGFVIKKDLSMIGRILYMALIGLLIATIVNIFIHSSTLYWAVSYIGVIIFTGLTAYDTQKIKRMLTLYAQQEDRETTMKIALLGSLTLYLDFVNLFIYLLRILGSRR